MLHPLSSLSWLLFGLLVGAIARLLLPGRQPIGLLATIGVGILGSFLGGFLGWAIHWGREPFSPAGWLLSILGSIIALAIYFWVTARRTWL